MIGKKPTATTSTDRVRQGVTGHNVRYVLLFGVLGLIAAYLIIVALGFTR